MKNYHVKNNEGTGSKPDYHTTNQTSGKKTDGNNVKDDDLDSLLRQSERILEDELGSIEFQIAEREKIKQRNLVLLEWQRQKLEELINRSECLSSLGVNDVKNKLTTLLVQVELKKGEEYVSAFRDVQRLEEEKRKLLSDVFEDQGWLEY